MPSHQQRWARLRASRRAEDAPSHLSRRTRVTLIVLTGVFVTFLDAFIVNIALPAIHRTFHSAPTADLSWVVSGYAIISAAMVLPGRPMGGSLRPAARLPPGLLVFVSASAACAWALSLALLITARAVQAGVELS